MSRLWQPPSPWVSSVVVRDHDSFGLAIQRPAFPLGDLPALSRYIGHLTLALLLLLVVWKIIPDDLRTPSMDRLLVSQPDSIKVRVVGDWADTTSDTGYLQRNTVPLTVRPIRDVLPAAIIPQRTIRTTVLTYRVQPGDTVLGIAEKFGLKGTSVLWANDALVEEPDSLQIGQALNILPIEGAYHTVAKGETLVSIAAKYKVDPAAIQGYGGNELAPPYTLEAGRKLIIPNGIQPPPPPRQIAATNATASAPQGAKKGSGRFAWPISGIISQRYWVGHQGIDIAGPKGTPVVAADAGFVANVSVSQYGYGKMIIIDHGNGYQTLYGHLNGFNVEAGQSVARGDVIGYRGSTGRSTGPHLHFEVLKNGAHFNPSDFLP